MVRSLLIIGLILLAGCKPEFSLMNTTKPIETVYAEVPLYIKGPPQAWQKHAILNYVRNNFRDPYTIRDAEISYYGMQAENSTRERTVVCVQMNARNGFGAYTGRRIVQFEFGKRSLRTATEDHPLCTEMHGSSLRYQPFPELEALKNL